jgi:hypothetical protein
MMIAAVLNIASVTRRPFELSAYELGRDAAILAMPLVALSLLWRERRA